MQVNIFERDMITDALKRADGNITAAARELGITARMVRYKIRNLGIDYGGLFRKTPPRATLPGDPKKKKTATPHGSFSTEETRKVT